MFSNTKPQAWRDRKEMNKHKVIDHYAAYSTACCTYKPEDRDKLICHFNEHSRVGLNHILLKIH